MRDSFLQLVARAFVKANDLDNIFLFPNRRSLKFFEKYLGIEYGKKNNKPLFSPELYTVKDFYSKISEIEVGEDLVLLFYLYKEYISLKYKGSEQSAELGGESFDSFLNWGDVILSDFDNIDKYLVDAKSLFRNIKELSDLNEDFSYLTDKQREAIKSFWTIFIGNGEGSSNVKESFRGLWDIVYQLYENFKKSIKENGISYEGAIYREVADKISQLSFDKNIVFIGLNAPNACEKVVMRSLKEHGKGDFYWDFFGEMVVDSDNSASKVIRDCVNEFPSKYEIEDNSLKCQEQKFTVYSSPSGVTQALVAANILDELYKDKLEVKGGGVETAVILPDENLLFPVLDKVPEKIKNINVSMGYSIGVTKFADLFSLIFNLQLGVREGERENGRYSFYHKDVISLLSHDYLKEDESVRSIRDEILKSNSIYVGPKLFRDKSQLIKTIFTPVIEQSYGDARAGNIDFINYLLKVLTIIDGSMEEREREFAYRYSTILNRLLSINFPLRRKTFISVLKKMTSKISVPFKGEPLSGLQILGPLETRLLDFKNVIILSANEGTYPSTSADSSIIPFNLRVGFGLPTFELRDGIAAYYFYRLLQRAENVYMIYDAREGGLTTGEESRYIKQLKWHYGININHFVVGSKISVPIEKEFEQLKTDEIQKQIDEYFKNEKLSASSINNYISCPLYFYFSSILKIKDRDDSVKEEVESNVFGTIFHSVMEELYKPFKGNMVSESDIKNILDGKGETLIKGKKVKTTINELVERIFKETVKVDKIEGKNLLYIDVLNTYVKRTLERDIKITPFKYINGEKRYEVKFVYGDAPDEVVNIVSYIDREDEIDGRLRLSDYKTGSSSKVTKLPVDCSYEYLKECIAKEDYAYINQLFIYALVVDLERNRSVDKNIYVYKIVNVAKEVTLQDAKSEMLGEFIDSSKIEVYKTLLKDIILEIKNKDIPFKANKSCNKCNYCGFGIICGKI